MSKGLVISGGGARGLFTIEILRQMRADKFNFNEVKFVSGVSVGSIIGALVAQGDLDVCLALFDSIRNKDVYKGKLSFWRVIWNLLTGKNYVISIEPLFVTLSKYVSLDKAQKSGVEFSFGLVDLKTGMYREFTQYDFETNNNYIRAIMASCSQEVIWQPQQFDTKYERIEYGADGGIVTSSPIKQALEADELIIINNTPSRIGYTTKLTKLYQVAYRMIDIMLNVSFNKDLKTFLERNESAKNGDKRYREIPYKLYQTSLIDDGLDFDTESVRNARIKDAQEQYKKSPV